MSRNLSQAKSLIKAWEGLRLKAYQDSAGIWTIGYGQTQRVKPGMVWTLEQAEADLDRDLRIYAAAVEKYVRPDTTDQEFCALLVFAWNVGPTGARNSVALKAHNARNPEGVHTSLLSWTTVTINGKRVRNYPGLVRRREAEWSLYKRGVIVCP